MSLRQTKEYGDSRLRYVYERSEQMFAERNTSGTVAVLLRLFSRKTAESLCYDYFQEKLWR